MYLVITENRPQLADFAEGSKKKKCSSEDLCENE